MPKSTRRFDLLPALAVALALALAPAAYAQRIDRDDVATSSRFAPEEAIVRFEPGADSADRLAARRAADVTLDRALEVPGHQLVEVEGPVSDVVKRLERQPDVAHAQPNYRYRALAPAPDDTFFFDQWGLEDSAAPDPGVGTLQAWDITDGAGQVIAIVDTGVALDHPDLAGNLWTGAGGIHGHDFVDGDADPDDFSFHGTHVAGTAAAVTGNGAGVAGVAPGAAIMAVRVLDGDGKGSSADIGDGIAFAAQNGADVINLSLGGPPGAGDVFVSNAVALADQRNAVVVAAAGNDSNDNDLNPTTPCNLPQANLICVAAVNRSGGLAGFSNFGAASVDVGAPGTGILSAKTDYAPIFGEDFDTSLAAWDSFTGAGSVPWGRTSRFSSGTHSVADSPTGLYANDSDSELWTAAPLDLTAERGCRVHLDLLYDIEDPDTDGSLFDFLFVGALTSDPEVFDGLPFAGESFGYDTGTFGPEEASIAGLDERPDVFPFLGMFSDASVREDGAYADDLAVLCRDSSYLDDKTAAGNYVTFQGTSMAAPHVAGIAALVRAADPGISDTEVVESIEQGGTPLASLAGKTVSGRTVDAGGAIASALGLLNPSPPSVPPVFAPSTAPAPPPPSMPTAPSSVSLASSKPSIQVSSRGVFRYAFSATPSLVGEIGFRIRRRLTIVRRAQLLLARKGFSAPSTGRVVVKVRLSNSQLRSLRRNGRFLLRVTVIARGPTGATARATRRLTLKPPKR